MFLASHLFPKIAAGRHRRKTTTLAQKSQANSVDDCFRGDCRTVIPRRPAAVQRDDEGCASLCQSPAKRLQQIPRRPAWAGLLGMTGSAMVARHANQDSSKHLFHDARHRLDAGVELVRIPSVGFRQPGRYNGRDLADWALTSPACEVSGPVDKAQYVNGICCQRIN